METKIIQLSDLQKGNNRLCLSPLRAVAGNCIRCMKYETCESKLVDKDGRGSFLLKQRLLLKQLLNETEKELENIGVHPILLR